MALDILGMNIDCIDCCSARSRFDPIRDGDGGDGGDGHVVDNTATAAMGIDLLRGGGSRAHFLVASFALLSMVLLFNWWSLSTDNLDLLKQIEGLTEHLKSSSSLLDQCRRDRASLDSRVKRLEDDTEKLIQNLDSEKGLVDRLENNAKESRKEAAALEKKFDGANSSLKLCVTELDSLKKVDISKDGVIASMRIEKSRLSNEIQELKDKIITLNNQLKQEKPVQTLSKKPASSTASVPSKVENDGNLDNELKNLAEPFHAAGKDLELKEEHNVDKEDQQITDEREQEMQDNGDERGGALT